MNDMKYSSILENQQLSLQIAAICLPPSFWVKSTTSACEVRLKVNTMMSHILRELLNIIAEIENELSTCIFYVVVNN